MRSGETKIEAGKEKKEKQEKRESFYYFGAATDFAGI